MLYTVAIQEYRKYIAPCQGCFNINKVHYNPETALMYPVLHYRMATHHYT